MGIDIRNRLALLFIKNDCLQLAQIYVLNDFFKKNNIS